jgi:hypothetical protein
MEKPKKSIIESDCDDLCSRIQSAIDDIIHQRIQDNHKSEVDGDSIGEFLRQEQFKN